MDELAIRINLLRRQLADLRSMKEDGHTTAHEGIARVEAELKVLDPPKAKE